MLKCAGKFLQVKKPDDFVIATDKQYSVKYFIERCFKYLNIKIKWVGKRNILLKAKIIMIFLKNIQI